MDLEASSEFPRGGGVTQPGRHAREYPISFPAIFSSKMPFHQNGFGAEAKDHLDVAMRLYGATADRSEFTPTLPIDGGLTSEALLIAGALTPVFGSVLLALYRRRMRVLMRATAKAPVACQAESWSPPPLPGANAHVIPLRARKAPPCRRRHCGPARLRMPPLLRRAGASWVHALSGGAFAAVASMLMFRLGDVEFSYVRCTHPPLAWGWRIVLAPHLLWGQRPMAAWYAARWLCRAAGGRLPDRRARRYTAARGRWNQHRTVLRAADFLGAAVLPALFLAFDSSRHPRRRPGAARLHDLRHVRCGGRRRRGEHAGWHESRCGNTGAARLVFASGRGRLAAVAGMVLFVPFGWIAVDLIGGAMK